MHKNNIAVNELVPRTLVTQLDLKVGNWKTTYFFYFCFLFKISFYFFYKKSYDIINDAPFRAEPLSKI